METHRAPFEARAVSAMSLDTDAGEATVKQVCEVFEMQRSTYYANRHRALPRPAGPSLRLLRGGLEAKGEPETPAPAPAAEADTKRRGVPVAQLRDAIAAVVAEHRAWGYRKVWATLRRPPYGLKASQRRVYALMRDMDLLLPPDRVHAADPPRGHVTVPDSNRRLATDFTTVYTREDGVCAVALVVDSGDRAVLAVQASKSQEAPAILAPVEQVLQAAFGEPKSVPEGLELRSDHGPQYTGADCRLLCSRWRLVHTFAPVGRPTGNALAERTIRTLKEECIWLRDFANLAELQAALNRWRQTFNHERPHQALAWQTPAERRAANLDACLAEAA